MLLQLPLQHTSVADNTFAVIRVIGVWSAISVVAGAPNDLPANRALEFRFELTV